MVDFLIKNGADIDAKGTTGETILMYYLYQFPNLGDAPITVNYLINHGANVNLSNGNETPLYRAIVDTIFYLDTKDFSLVRLLLEKGAIVKKSDLEFVESKGRLFGSLLDLLKSYNKV